MFDFLKKWIAPRRRDRFTIIMPSGRIVTMEVDEDGARVDLGKAKEYGIKESFEDVGKALDQALRHHGKS